MDMVALEADYRLGLIALRPLGKKYGLSGARVQQMAEENGWEQNLEGRIAVKTQAKLAKKIAETDKQLAKQETALAAVTESVIKDRIEVVATLQADLLTKHRDDITQYQAMCDGFLNELHLQGLCDADLAKIGELVAMIETQTNPQPDMDAVQKRLNAFYKILNLGGRAETFKKLVESKAKLIMLERISHGIRDNFAPPPPSNTGGSTDELTALLSIMDTTRHD